MPRVRYGPDITDDAASLIMDADRIAKKLKQANTPAARARLISQRDLINKGIKDVFGSRANARKLAKESLRRQGYATAEQIRAAGAKKFKPVKGSGQLGLAATPGRGNQAIGRKKGYGARPESNYPDLYKTATKKAKAAKAILRQVKAQDTAGASARKKAQKAAAVKKAKPAKKAATAKKAVAKKAAPRKRA